MFGIFMKNKVLSITIIVLLVLSIICQVVMGILFQNMIKEADNMPTTENKLLKQCKLKFTNCYKLNGSMLNTSVFVDKFISRIQFMGISLTKLTHLAGQLMMLSVVVTGIAVCLRLIAGDTLFQIIPYYLSSILGLYLYFSVSGVVDIQGKKKLLKINLVDYLENHLMPRLEIEKEAVRETEKGLRELDAAVIDKENLFEEAEKLFDNEEESAGKKAVKPEKSILASTQQTMQEQEELENLLKEFFA